MSVDAMIFAAGFGSRLGELGRDTPKALIDIAGQTMLERVVLQLILAGADRIVVNVHHHADAIERFVAGRRFGAEILVSREEARPLETGGGLLNARAFFRGTAPIVLHNVDVITEAGLDALIRAHQGSSSLVADSPGSGALATLAVNERETARYLLFDDAGLMGREDRRTGERRLVRPARGMVRAFAFAGIHVASPRLLDLITEEGVFPILDVYLRLAAGGHTIAPWLLRGGWFEIGNAGRLAAARAALETRKGPTHRVEPLS